MSETNYSSPDVTFGPLLKVERANRHIDELRQLTSPLSREMYSIGVEQGYGTLVDPNEPNFQLMYRPIKPIPELLALCIGDAVHNLRAALDHLSGGILRAWHPAPPPKPHFPVHSERKSLVTDKHLSLVEEALPGSKELLLEKIRPTDGPNEHLWRFTTLDNNDKHNFILPTINLVEIANINYSTGGNTRVQNVTMGGNAATPHRLARSNRPIAVQQDFQTAVEVKFAQGSVFENQPVIPTLLQLSELVSEVIATFGRFIQSKQAPA